MKKLSLKTMRRITLIQNFLKTDIGSSGILVDSDWTLIYIIQKIYYNATGIYIVGMDCHSKQKKDRIEQTEFSKVFNSAFKQDEDFNNYVKEFELKTLIENECDGGNGEFEKYIPKELKEKSLQSDATYLPIINDQDQIEWKQIF